MLGAAGTASADPGDLGNWAAGTASAGQWDVSNWAVPADIVTAMQSLGVGVDSPDGGAVGGGSALEAGAWGN